MSELIFVGGITGKSKWLDNGKSLSRNFRQGNRVYHADGMATALTSQPVDSTGGFTSLYLVDENHISDYKFKMEEFLLKKEFTYYSLFSGIGGMTMGLEPLGGKCLGAWEYDPAEKKTQFAQEAHKLLHPHIPIHGDVTKIIPEELEDFDVLCFTPPCQAFSVAGKRGGFEDTRGTLTFDALRVAKVKQPKILFMENVKGLVNHDKGNTLGTIIRAINEIGYTVDFTVLNSKYFDVAQNRERVYLIAIRDNLITPEPWIDTKGNTMLPKAKRKYQDEGAKTFNFDWCEQVEVRTKLKDFLEDNVDEKYYISDEKVAQLIAKLDEKDLLVGSVASHPFSKKLEFNGFNNDRYSPAMIATDYKAPKCKLEGIPIKEATTKGYSVANEGDAVNIQFPNSKTRRGRVGKQIANTLEASAVNQGVVELSPEFKDIISDDIKEIISKTRPNQKEIGITFNENGDIRPHKLDERKSGISELNINYEENSTFTITASHAPKIYGNSTKYRIRKLTPRECLRLQSISEEYIDKLEEVFSDSKLYKFAGNGLTINVIRAIGEKIITYI